ncbi:hypothetical protein H6S82_05535 [Planktothrix sp. FACHB-1355]|uniref:hypothetical protein n=1 Tax=Planktothrix sp. FACHB-1355 TaxID=2692854 RepID=UPI00168B5F89|nr:hypothetical protein [Planktothrix sp. FACHB-1355]MBD3558318.1 hypothetical protein [Planktothrix sp. FACHB-1355]
MSIAYNRSSKKIPVTAIAFTVGALSILGIMGIGLMMSLKDKTITQTDRVLTAKVKLASANKKFFTSTVSFDFGTLNNKGEVIIQNPGYLQQALLAVAAQDKARARRVIDDRKSLAYRQEETYAASLLELGIKQEMSRVALVSPDKIVEWRVYQSQSGEWRKEPVTAARRLSHLTVDLMSNRLGQHSRYSVDYSSVETVSGLGKSLDGATKATYDLYLAKGMDRQVRELQALEIRPDFSVEKSLLVKPGEFGSAIKPKDKPKSNAENKAQQKPNPKKVEPIPKIDKPKK